MARLTKAQLSDQIATAVVFLQATDEGCSTIKLDDHLAVCVGWSDGYADDDKWVIHSKTSPSWGITAGIKVWTSDDMRTDFDWINAPYYEDGEVIDSIFPVGHETNYNDLAGYFLKDYKVMSKLEMNKNGLILNDNR